VDTDRTAEAGSGGAQSVVLVVDDERFFREAISDVLERQGIPYALAASGEEALERAADGAIGVVVLDIELPGMNGLETFRHLRERRSELRVIILSAHTHQEYVLEALRLGAFDYLAKPLHEEELSLAVRRARESFAVAAGFHRLRRRLDGLAARLQRLGAIAREDGADTRQAAVEAASEARRLPHLADAARRDRHRAARRSRPRRQAAARGDEPGAARAGRRGSRRGALRAAAGARRPARRASGRTRRA
jgi:DNA-binding response OmpR family regulator